MKLVVGLLSCLAVLGFGGAAYQGLPNVNISQVSGTVVSGTNGLPTTITDNTAVLTTALVDLGASGDTVYVSYRDSAGLPILLTDTNSVSYSSVSIAVPAAGFTSIAYALLNTCKPDGSHFIAALPASPASIHIFVQTGSNGTSSASVGVNFGGLASGAAGTAGTGCNTGFQPLTTATIRLYQGDSGRWGWTR